MEPIVFRSLKSPGLEGPRQRQGWSEDGEDIIIIRPSDYNQLTVTRVVQYGRLAERFVPSCCTLKTATSALLWQELVACDGARLPVLIQEEHSPCKQ